MFEEIIFIQDLPLTGFYRTHVFTIHTAISSNSSVSCMWGEKRGTFTADMSVEFRIILPEQNQLLLHAPVDETKK